MPSSSLNYLKMSHKERDRFVAQWMVGFLNETFPGLDTRNIYPQYILQLMTASDPTSLISADVTLEGGYDPCSDGKRRRKKRHTIKDPTCPDGFHYHATLEFCYIILNQDDTEDFGMDWCQFSESEPMKFFGDDEISAFVDLANNGKNPI